MATSRTGTATYLRARKQVLRDAQAAGLTHCPGYDGRPCGRELNYDVPLLEESAETDHVIEHRHGGTDDKDNLRVICRHCNRARNNTRAPVAVPDPNDFPTSRPW